MVAAGSMITGAVVSEVAWVCRPVSYIAILSTITIIGLKFLTFALLNHLFKYGISYAVKHSRLTRKIENELIRCEVFLNKYKEGNNSFYDPVEVLMKLDKRFHGYIYIRDLPKYHSKLENLEFSSVMPEFLVVENKYMNDSRTHWILEVTSFELNPLTIRSVEQLREISEADNYKIAITDSLSVPIHHGLLIGQTGSGKSYSLIYIIFQLFCKRAELFIADPKMSDISVLSAELLPEGYYASDITDIISLVEKFGEVLKERQCTIQKHLKSSSEIACDYRDFGLRPVILVIDEFSAFILSLPKKEHDLVMNILLAVVLKGRQVGVFVVLAQQQTNAKNLSTELRENIPLKIILGNSGRETYITAIGQIPEASKRRFETGQGLLVYPGISTEENPKIIAMPLLQQNVLSKDGIKALRKAVERDYDSDSVSV